MVTHTTWPRPPPSRVAAAVRRRPVAVWFVLLLVVNWPVQLFAGPATAVAVAVTGPSVCAFVVCLVGYGRAGARELGGRLLRWRVPVRYYAVALVGVVAVLVGVAYAFTAVAYPSRLAAPPGSVLIPLAINAVLIFVLAGLGEEFGWRGFALPRLQERYGPLRAGLLVGVLWAGWHVPIVVRNNAHWPVVLAFFVPGVVAASLVYTWLFNRTGGSVLLVALLHAAENTWTGLPYHAVFSFDPPGPEFFDALRETTYVALALAVVALTRARLGRAEKP